MQIKWLYHTDFHAVSESMVINDLSILSEKLEKALYQQRVKVKLIFFHFTIHLQHLNLKTENINAITQSKLVLLDIHIFITWES